MKPTLQTIASTRLELHAASLLSFSAHNPPAKLLIHSTRKFLNKVSESTESACREEVEIQIMPATLQYHNFKALRRRPQCALSGTQRSDVLALCGPHAIELVRQPEDLRYAPSIFFNNEPHRSGLHNRGYRRHVACDCVEEERGRVGGVEDAAVGRGDVSWVERTQRNGVSSRALGTVGDGAAGTAVPLMASDVRMSAAKGDFAPSTTAPKFSRPAPALCPTPMSVLKGGRRAIGNQ